MQKWLGVIIGVQSLAAVVVLGLALTVGRQTNAPDSSTSNDAEAEEVQHTETPSDAHSDAGTAVAKVDPEALTPLPLTPPAIPAAKLSPPEIVVALDEGNERFVAGVVKSRDLVQRRRENEAQFRPLAAVVTCADGRLPPEALFDLSIGDLYVIRLHDLSDAKLVSAALEFTHKKHATSVALLLAHEACGDGASKPEDLVTKLRSALLQTSRTLREAEKNGHLTILRASASLLTGRVQWLDIDQSASPEKAETGEKHAGVVAGELTK